MNHDEYRYERAQELATEAYLDEMQEEADREFYAQQSFNEFHGVTEEEA